MSKFTLSRSTFVIFRCAVYGLPSGPVIVLVASFFFLVSLLLGSRASVRSRLSHPVHLRG